MSPTAASMNVHEPPQSVFKTAILPAPAGHGLLYGTHTVRIVSGLIESFFATAIDHRLSLGWQLQHLATEGKWDVKNLEKWKRVQPVSEPIAGLFRAMKTLREADETHTPSVFAEQWGAGAAVAQDDPDHNPRIRVVVDISHESPVYDPKGLERAGVGYHKFPTVSKLPPTIDEVRSFIALIDSIRSEVDHTGGEAAGECNVISEGSVIGVHCHYGFNRTGFFLVSYLVERCDYDVQSALDHFAVKRPPGIRHDHFINELFVRYGYGLTRRVSEGTTHRGENFSE